MEILSGRVPVDYSRPAAEVCADLFIPELYVACFFYHRSVNKIDFSGQLG